MLESESVTWNQPQACLKHGFQGNTNLLFKVWYGMVCQRLVVMLNVACLVLIKIFLIKNAFRDCFRAQ